MTRLHLRLYTNPGEAQIFCNFATKEGGFERTTVTIDTGAAISLFPRELLALVDHQIIDEEVFVEQAGVSSQEFRAVEARVTVVLEDERGQRTEPIVIRAWFTETWTHLIGFADLLEKAVLHIDMPQLEGWLEL
jgi:hypothetical protein